MKTNLSFGTNVCLGHPLESWKFSSEPKKNLQKAPWGLCVVLRKPMGPQSMVFTGESNLWISRPQASNWDLAAGKPAMLEISAGPETLPFDVMDLKIIGPAKNSQILRVPQIRSYLAFWVPENAGEVTEINYFGKAAPFQGKLPSLKHRNIRGAKHLLYMVEVEVRSRIISWGASPISDGSYHQATSKRWVQWPWHWKSHILMGI